MNALQLVIVAMLGVLMVMPCVAIVWKGTELRRHLWNGGCWRWVMCCDRLLGERVEHIEAQSLTAHYQRMFEERTRPSLALRLAAWRADVLGHRRSDPVTVKLQHISGSVQAQTMERTEMTSIEAIPRSNRLPAGDDATATGATAENAVTIVVHDGPTNSA